MSQLSLVDAAGALRDAEARYADLLSKKKDLRTALDEVDTALNLAREAQVQAQENLYRAATASEVTIL